MKKMLVVIILVLTIVTLSACEENGDSDKLQVVATTTYVGELLKNIGGDLIEVEVLMGVGVDPHDYQPRQSDTQKIARADLLVINGLNLEEKMGEVFRNLDQEKVLVLGDHVDEADLLYEAGGEVDPHIWFNLDIWGHLALVVSERLADHLPEHGDTFAVRAEAYIKDLTMLDIYIRTRVEALPEENRVLVTAHDAFAYFGEAYGFEVHAIQGISTESEASIADINALAQLLVSLDIHKVFFETSIPQATVNALVEAAQALDHDVSVGGALYSDSLGAPEYGHETFLRTYRYNVDTIIDALME